ncbi:MAG TPA: CHAD domain-containing protein, partial [bacterium]
MAVHVLPAGLGVEELAERLAPLGHVRVAGARTERITLLDTFDWRLHRAGVRLDAAGGPPPHLRLRPLQGGRPLAAARTGGVPRWIRDLPPGTLRERLAPLVEPRALLPLATGSVTVTRLELTVSGRAQPLVLSHEAALVAAPGAEPCLPLRPALVTPDTAQAAPLRALAAAWPDVEPAPADTVAALLEPLGRAPRDYSGKVRVPLDPAAPARDAARALLLHLLGTLEANLPGVRADTDPEFLHDVRVAVRRTRSALGQLKGVLPPATAARFAAAFAGLQELTGPARDLDVYVLELPALGRLL